MTRVLTYIAFLCCISTLHAAERLPIIDMHMHALPADAQGPPPLAICTPMTYPAWDQIKPYGAQFMQMAKQPECSDPVWSPETDAELKAQTVEVMQRRNIVGVLSGSPERVQEWMAAAPGRFIPGLGFNVARPNTPSPEELRTLNDNGQLDVLAEITNQYSGIEPDDERMTPYWSLMESLDVPVGIHIGNGPPGVIYLGSPNYRARMHSPLSLEEVLVAHPKLRVYIMHAGYPMLDDLLAVLYAHPQVRVEVGIIVHTVPRPAFYRFLSGIIDAGFADRIMYGSDQMIWPGTIERGIAVIEEAPFLDDEMKRDIFYNNAAKFLRLSEEEVARHHALGHE